MSSLLPNPDPWLPSAPVPVNRAGAVLRVFSTVAGLDELAELDNVVCLAIEQHAGTDPGTALFRYRFTERDENAPQNLEQAFDTNYSLDKAVFPGDRLIVTTEQPDGTPVYLFDGHAIDFEAETSDTSETGIFAAQGVAKRLWDDIIPGMLMRACDDVYTGSNVQTDLPAQFNPKGKPNRVPVGAETQAPDGDYYPVFLDPAFVQSPDVREWWSLADAVKYLLKTMNAAETWVANPDFDRLDEILVARQPKAGIAFDPDDADTYDAAPIIISDKPITGRDWPTVLHELLRNKGFDMDFFLETNESTGDPSTRLRIWLQQSGSPKTLYLQQRFETLDPSYSNTSAIGIKRDFGSVASVWTVKGRPVRYECAFILSPLFPQTSADASAGSLGRWDATAIKKTPADADTYRVWGLDECGEGHYPILAVAGNSTKLTTKFNFDSLLGAGKWVTRRRKPIGELFAKGADGKPMKARLDYSTTYTGSMNVFAPSGGTWKPITGSWTLLEDRIGIRITAEHPNAWKVGVDPDTGQPVVLRGVEGLIGGTGTTPYYLRLTCVIEADEVVKGTAIRRDQCPLPYDIARVVDASDRLQKNIVDTSSPNNSTGKAIVSRDDSDNAKAEATTYQVASDMGVLSGPVTIPYLTTYYEIGDRISGVAGRGLGFRTDGGESTDLKVYPVVEGIRWEFGNRQTTTLYLSDEAQQRHAIERKLAR